MDPETFTIVTWVLGALAGLIAFLFTIWWKIERRQDQKIDDFVASNGREHIELHEKIDKQHHAIRDRLDNIWKHMRPHD